MDTKFDAAKDAVSNVIAAALMNLKDASDEGYGIKPDSFEDVEDVENGESFIYISDVTDEVVKVIVTAFVVKQGE